MTNTIKNTPFIRELKLINTGFKENDAISKIQINDEIRKRLIQSLTGKGQTEVVDLDIYNLLRTNLVKMAHFIFFCVFIMKLTNKLAIFLPQTSTYSPFFKK